MVSYMYYHILNKLLQNTNIISCRIIKLRGGQFSWIMGFLPICKDAILWKRRFLVLLGKINLP